MAQHTDPTDFARLVGLKDPAEIAHELARLDALGLRPLIHRLIPTFRGLAVELLDDNDSADPFLKKIPRSRDNPAPRSRWYPSGGDRDHRGPRPLAHPDPLLSETAT